MSSTSSEKVPSSESSVAAAAIAAPVAKAPIDVNSLLSNLLKIGLIKDPAKKEVAAPSLPIPGLVSTSQNKVDGVETKPSIQQVGALLSVVISTKHKVVSYCLSIFLNFKRYEKNVNMSLLLPNFHSSRISYYLPSKSK